MDLDNMKNTWNELSELRSQETFLDEDSIRRITHEKSSSRLRKIIGSESLGIAMAIAMVIYLAFNFYKLDTTALLIFGYGTMTILLVSMALGGRIISQASKINIRQNTYSQTLNDFSALKKTLGLYKRLSIPVSFLMPFMLIPVFYKIWLGKNVLDHLVEFRTVIIISLILVPTMLYVIFYFYSKNVKQIGDAIKNMEDSNS